MQSIYCILMYLFIYIYIVNKNVLKRLPLLYVIVSPYYIFFIYLHARKTNLNLIKNHNFFLLCIPICHHLCYSSFVTSSLILQPSFMLSSSTFVFLELAFLMQFASLLALLAPLVLLTPLAPLVPPTPLLKLACHLEPTSPPSQKAHPMVSPQDIHLGQAQGFLNQLIL